MGQKWLAGVVPLHGSGCFAPCASIPSATQINAIFVYPAACRGPDRRYLAYGAYPPKFLQLY